MCTGVMRVVGEQLRKPDVNQELGSTEHHITGHILNFSWDLRELEESICSTLRRRRTDASFSAPHLPLLHVVSNLEKFRMQTSSRQAIPYPAHRPIKGNM
jgi:hypothetical protein